MEGETCWVETDVMDPKSSFIFQKCGDNSETHIASIDTPDVDTTADDTGSLPDYCAGCFYLR